MRRQITESDQAAELPDLTEQQKAFVDGILAGKSGADAYRAAYNCSQMSNAVVWKEACILRSNRKVAVWLAAARKAGLGASVVTLSDHIKELERLREIALDTGNVGAAVQAEQLRGKAMGHYVDRVETTDLTDIRQELEEIRKISPEAADAYAKQKGLH